MDAQFVWLGLGRLSRHCSHGSKRGPQRASKIQSFAGFFCETEKDDSSAGKTSEIVISQSPDAPTKLRLRDCRDLVHH